MTAIQSRHPSSDKPVAPRRNKTSTTPHGLTHGRPRRPLSQGQNDAGSPRGIGPPAPASHLSAKFHPSCVVKRIMLVMNSSIVFEWMLQSSLAIVIG